MSVKINVDLDQVGGGVVASGSIVRYGVRSLPNPTKFIFTTEVYRSQQDIDNGEDSINLKVVENSYSIPLDTPLVATPTISIVGDIGALLDQVMKDVLEAIPEIGVGNVEII